MFPVGKCNTINRKRFENTIITVKKRFLFVVGCIAAAFCSAALAVTVTAPADIPAYYAQIDGQSGANLFEEVHAVAKEGYHSLGYDGLWSAYAKTDLRADGTVWDMYSDCEWTLNKGQCGNYKNECDCYNREHSIPKSWFGGNTSGPGCDIFHLVPTDGKVNGMRSNYPFGEVQSATYTSKNGSKLGSAENINLSGKSIAGTSGITATCSDRVFEPVDEYKGDFARGYLGTMIRWAGDYQSFTSGNGSSVFSSGYTAGSYFGLTKYGVALLLKWHRQDPVSQKEIDRNNGIQATQGNRNPFIDYPYLAEYIWGVRAGEKVDLQQLLNSQDARFVPGESDGSLTDQTPALYVSRNDVSFVGAIPGEAVWQTISIRGTNLTGGVQCNLGGTHMAMFSVSPTNVPAADANGTHTLTLTYKPAEKGIHTAVLSVSTAGVEEQVVRLYGACNEGCSVTWQVDGATYTQGNPTQSVAAGGRVTAIPAAPASCSGSSEQFVGWSETAWSGEQEEVPAGLFSDESEAPVVVQDVVYYAVFAHLGQTDGGSDTTVLTMADNAGWTVSGTIDKEKYRILATNASIETPVLDRSTVQSVVVAMRTYGGSSYNTVIISCDGQTVGTLKATNNELKDYIWTPSAPLDGTGTIRFSSANSTSANGPAVGRIILYSKSTQYVYSRFVTQCTDTATDVLDSGGRSCPATKELHHAQLYIRCGGVLYNIWGQVVKEQ